jgi:hypothetical protein
MLRVELATGYQEHGRQYLVLHGFIEIGMITMEVLTMHAALTKIRGSHLRKWQIS